MKFIISIILLLSSFLSTSICMAQATSLPIETLKYSIAEVHNNLTRLSISTRDPEFQKKILDLNEIFLRKAAKIAKEKEKPYFMVFWSLREAAIAKHRKATNIGQIFGSETIALGYLLFLDKPYVGVKETEKTLRDTAYWNKI